MAKGWVYPAGPMGGLSYEKATGWRDYAEKELGKEGIILHSPARGIKDLVGEKIDANDSDHPLRQPNGLTARDRFDLSRCDVVLMNVLDGEEILSIGTCIEIGWADHLRKIIVLVCQKDGAFDNHPMVKACAAYKVHDLDDALTIIKSILLI